MTGRFPVTSAVRILRKAACCSKKENSKRPEKHSVWPQSIWKILLVRTILTQRWHGSQQNFFAIPNKFPILPQKITYPRDVICHSSPISTVKAGATKPPRKNGDIDMKKLLVITLVAFAGICSGSLASAQAHQLRGQIPFDFTAGSARLSAGEYRVTYDISGLVTFRNLEKGNGATMFVGADQGVNDGTCKLVFARYGDQYFLKQSKCSVANANFFVPTSGRQKWAQEQAASKHDGEQTAVAMK